MTAFRLPVSLRLLAALAACAVALAAAAVVWPREASGHALAIASEPAANSQVQEPPTSIAIDFNEPIEPSLSTIQLWDQQGEEVALGQPRFFDDPKRMAIDIPVELEPGIYTVIWRNLSTVDAHTWQGSFPFTVLGPGGEVPEGAVASIVSDIAQGPSDTPSTLDTASRWVVLLAASLMAGGTAFVLGVVRPSLRYLSKGAAEKTWETSRTVLLVTAAIAAFFALDGSLLQLAVQADSFGGLEAADELLLDTRFGKYLLARQGLAIVAMVAVVVAWRGHKNAAGAIGLWGLLLASAGLLVTHSLVSHAASMSEGQFWAVAVDLLHVGATAIWLGALLHIALTLPRWLELLRAGPRTVFAAHAFRRFSGLATVSVALLLASGVLSAAIQVPDWHYLIDTNWGRSLIAKLGLAIPLLGIGALNAYILRPRVVDAVLVEQSPPVVVRKPGQGSSEQLRRLHRTVLNTIRLEVAFGVAVLLVAAILIQLQSPRVTADVASSIAEATGDTPAPGVDDAISGSYVEAVEVEALQVFLSIDPAEVGENDFRLGIASEFANVPEVLQARLDFQYEDEVVGASRLEVPVITSNTSQWLFGTNATNLSLPGDWTVTANFRLRGEDDLVQEFEVPVGGAGASAAAEGDIWSWPLDSPFAYGAMGVIAGMALGGAAWQFALRPALRRRG